MGFLWKKRSEVSTLEDDIAPFHRVVKMASAAAAQMWTAVLYFPPLAFVAMYSTLDEQMPELANEARLSQPEHISPTNPPISGPCPAAKTRGQSR